MNVVKTKPPTEITIGNSDIDDSPRTGLNVLEIESLNRDIKHYCKVNSSQELADNNEANSSQSSTGYFPNTDFFHFTAEYNWRYLLYVSNPFLKDTIFQQQIKGHTKVGV